MNKFHTTVGAALLSIGVSFAQEPPTGSPQPGSQQPPRQQPQDPAANRAHHNMNAQGREQGEAILATWLLVDNENEIALARIAQQRATSPEVKQFAQKMIDDHTQLVSKLQQVAGVSVSGNDAMGAARRTGDTTRPNEAKPGETRTNEAKPGETRSDDTTRQPADASGVRTNPAGMGMAGAFDHQQLIRELGRKCLASATKALEEKQGAEFDRCYMGMQIAAHMQAVDKIEVFRNHVSGNLRSTLDEGLKVVQAHLQHAKDLAKRTELASADTRR